MKVTSDLGPITQALVAAGHQAASAFEADVRASIPHRTGATAAATRVVETDDGTSASFRVEGPPQLAALEHGANVGARRGPHMGAEHPIANVADRFGAHLQEALR